MIKADEMAWNVHDWQLNAEIKITMASQQEHRMGTHNMTKIR